MINDSLKIKQNNDGSFTAEWDKQDPNWKWMNNFKNKFKLPDDDVGGSDSF